jgi:diguanylate cyclase (GGDEF)-like protein
MLRTSDPVVTRSPILALVSFALVTMGVLGIAHVFKDQSILLALLVVPLLFQLWITYTAPRRYTIASVTLFSLFTVGASSLSPTGAALVLQCAALSLAANAYLGLSVPALIADNRRMREQLARDRLTGAMSRACFEDRAHAAVDVASASLRHLSMVLFDLNGLKAINDRLGHLAGDALLVSAVQRCQSCLLADDTLARLGGDEFVVLLPGRNAEDALGVVNALRRALGTLEIDGVRGTVSASFGVASWASGDTAEAMLARADAAMYVDKRSARDTVGRQLMGDGAPADAPGQRIRMD